MVSIGAAAVGCSGPQVFFEHTPTHEPFAERLNAGAIRVRWPDSFSNESVAIFVGTDPSRIERGVPIAIATGRSARLNEDDTTGIDWDRRLFFELVPTGNGEPVVVAERRLPLECCDNFRDLGGYRTVDGRRVRWNRLYRANDLSALDGDDLEYLSPLNIKLVCDFRSERERTAKPDRQIDPTTREISLPIVQEGVDPAEMQRKIRTGGMAGLGIRSTMLEAYRAFVTDYADEWKAMFDRISDGANLPTVVHCTAGKDRTGFASALVLFALGVPEESVFEDYLLTNYYQQNFVRFVLRWVPLYSFFRTDPEDLRPLLEARREYLQASIDAMVETYGSIDAYLQRGLGLTPERRANLADLLLAPAR